MYVDAPAANVVHVPLQDLLRSVPTFKSGFEKLIFIRCKPLIVINNSPIDLGQISLKMHKYKSDSEVALLPHNKTVASFPSGILLPSVCACAAFVDIATKNKAMYKQMAKKEKANIQKH